MVRKTSDTAGMLSTDLQLPVRDSLAGSPQSDDGQAESGIARLRPSIVPEHRSSNSVASTNGSLPNTLDLIDGMKHAVVGMASIERKIKAERLEFIRALFPSIDLWLLPTNPTIMMHPDDYATLKSAVSSRGMSMTDLPLRIHSSGLIKKGEVLIVPSTSLDPVKRTARDF